MVEFSLPYELPKTEQEGVPTESGWTPLPQKTPEGKPIIYYSVAEKGKNPSYNIHDPVTREVISNMDYYALNYRSDPSNKMYYKGEVFSQLPPIPEVQESIASYKEHGYKKEMAQKRAEDAAKEIPTEIKQIAYYYNPSTGLKTYRVGGVEPKEGYLPITQSQYESNIPLQVKETKVETILVKQPQEESWTTSKSFAESTQGKQVVGFEMKVPEVK
jgi:hypothetical protein